MSGRALSLSPKKDRSTSRRYGPLERPDHKRRIKREDDDVFIKAEPEDEKPHRRLVKTESTDAVGRKPCIVVPKQEEPPQDNPEPLFSEAELASMKYLRLVGATENVPEGHNKVDSDGRIYNPTLAVRRYEYYNYYTSKEKSGGCKPEDCPVCQFFTILIETHY